MMDNKLDERDLELFAAAGGVHLRFNPRLATPWVAWCEADGFNLTAYGDRPWTAVEELYKVVVARGEGSIYTQDNPSPVLEHLALGLIGGENDNDQTQGKIFAGYGNAMPFKT